MIWRRGIVILSSKAKDKEEREIPILPTLRKILDRRKVGPDGSELPADAYAFGNETGDMLTRKRLCDLWKATCERAKVKNLHLHDRAPKPVASFSNPACRFTRSGMRSGIRAQR